MAEIKPFNGILFNAAKTGGDISKVIAPPYDVISAADQDRLYAKDDHNYVRVILGKTSSKDT